MVLHPELGGYRPGQVFFTESDLDRIKRQEIAPAITKFDKKTGHTHVEAPSHEQRGKDDHVGQS